MTPSVERPASARPVVPVVAVTRAKPSTEAAPQPRRSPRGAPRAVAIAALAVFAGLAPRPVEGDEGVPVSIENQSQYELFEL
ncbi:hypothetical protein L6R52_42825, partial [Myxococcota bacterium]|nr:hypothetical protein [Myxococcota bacterium]